VSILPAAESVFVTGSLEIGIRVDERVVLAGHFAVGFAPVRQALVVLLDVLWAVAEDAIVTIVNARAAPIAQSPLFRVVIFPPFAAAASIATAKAPSLEGWKEAGDMPPDVPRPDGMVSPMSQAKRTRPSIDRAERASQCRCVDEHGGV
jgi:hypothetical protein